MTQTAKVEINLNNIKHNFEQIIHMVGGKVDIFPVIKADGYGHGADRIASMLEIHAQVPYFAVAAVNEGILLRQNGSNKNILILSRISSRDIENLYRYNLTPVVHNLPMLSKIIEFSKSRGCRFDIHIKIDTGMNRIGFQDNELKRIAEVCMNNKEYINIVGIMSHFPSSESNAVQTKKQFDKFIDSTNYLKSFGISALYYHIANSGAIIEHPYTHLNSVRPGIALYGYHPGQNYRNIDLKPAMSVKSFVISKHRLKKGEGISYGPSFTADKDMEAAIVAFGYADGLFRNLSNKFSCIINDKLCRSIGTICMDAFACDVSGLNVKAGDEVILMGSSKNHSINADTLADISGTISYEILTNIGKSLRVRRIYV